MNAGAAASVVDVAEADCVAVLERVLWLFRASVAAVFAPDPYARDEDGNEDGRD